MGLLLAWHGIPVLTTGDDPLRPRSSNAYAAMDELSRPDWGARTHAVVVSGARSGVGVPTVGRRAGVLGRARDQNPRCLRTPGWILAALHAKENAEIIRG